MTEVVPPAGVDPTATGPAPHELAQSRQLFQQAVELGAPYEAINAEWMANGGDGPLKPMSAKGQFDVLRKDRDFVKRVQQGDPAAIEKLHSLPGDAANENAVLDKELPGMKAADLKLGPIAGATPEQAAAMHETIGGWGEVAQMPAATMNYIAKEAGAVADRFQKMNESQRQAFAVAERATLDKLWKGEAQRNIDMAKQLVREIAATERGKGVIDFLERSGAGNSSAVIAQLYGHASRLAARRK